MAGSHGVRVDFAVLHDRAGRASIGREVFVQGCTDIDNHRADSGLKG